MVTDQELKPKEHFAHLLPAGVDLHEEGLHMEKNVLGIDTVYGQSREISDGSFGQLDSMGAYLSEFQSMGVYSTEFQSMEDSPMLYD